ncbi:MAG: hypothetical protein BME94_00650 [Methanobacteriales archaeon Met13]
MKELYVLLGDVISSRKILDRPAFQHKLGEAVFKVNQEYENDLYSQMKILKGADEVGETLTTITNIYDIMNLLWDALYPHQMRFVLVKGKIDTGLTTKNIAKMDGPALHHASDLMRTLKSEKLLFEMSTGQKIIDLSLTGALNGTIMLKKRWSPKKREIVKEYEKTGKQRLVALKLKIKQQTVSEHLKMPNLNEITILEQKIRDALKLYSAQENLNGRV